MSLTKKGEGMKARRSIAGFTLIELMIVVVVVGILAAIAYPNYTDQVRKSRRGQAKADLVEYAQMAERWHTVNNSYTVPPFALPVLQSPREAGSTARYRLNLAQTANTFVITATPLDRQAEDTCGTLSLSNTGAKTNSAGTLGDCW